MVHLIAYELAGIRMPDETARIEGGIKDLGPAYAFHKSTWLVESELSNKEISERLSGLVRPKDRLLVMRIHKDWSTANVADAESDWLTSRNYTSVNDPPTFPTARPQR